MRVHAAREERERERQSERRVREHGGDARAVTQTAEDIAEQPGGGAEQQKQRRLAELYRRGQLHQ